MNSTIRYHVAALLRAVAHRIHPIDTDAIPHIIKVPPGTLDKMTMNVARPSTELRAAYERARAASDAAFKDRPTRRPPAGGAGEAKAL